MGYIEKIFNVESHTQKEKNIEFKILKFILNNNDGMRIQCNIYNDNIEKFNLKKNEVMFNNYFIKKITYIYFLHLYYII